MDGEGRQMDEWINGKVNSLNVDWTLTICQHCCKGWSLEVSKIDSLLLRSLNGG